MRELKTANDALGDREALGRIWNQHGYWFFRDVLDKAALGAMRDEYMRELKALDFVSADASEPVWTGRSLETFPAKFEALHQRRVWQTFVESPKVRAFFEDVLNDEIYWLPMDYYRVVAPKNPDDGPNIAVHQDGVTNPGIDFVTCWMPLMDVDRQVGGLFVADGHHGYGYMHMIDGRCQFPDRTIPDGCWRTADYRPGDVVIFAPSTPHFGQSNSSGRFRLSLDIRAVRRSSRLPVVGTVRSISTDHVVIHNQDGADVALRLNDKTFVYARVPNSPNPTVVGRERAPQAMPPGERVMATEHDGLALVLRPQS